MQTNSAKESSIDTEVAYLTHEGMFISDAFREGDLPSTVADSVSQRNLYQDSQPSSSDSVSEAECTTDSSSSKEQTSSSVTLGGVEIMYVVKVFNLEPDPNSRHDWFQLYKCEHS